MGLVAAALLASLPSGGVAVQPQGHLRHSGGSSLASKAAVPAAAHGVSGPNAALVAVSREPEGGVSVAPAIIMSLIAGLSTVLGALVVFVIDGEPRPSLMAMTLGLAAGVMVTVSVLELWPHGESGGHYGLWGQIGAFAVGGALYFLVSCVVPSPDLKAVDGGDKDPEVRKRAAHRLWVVLFIVLTAHNFPEGLAVAMSAVHSARLGLIVMIAIALHNIPEGLTIAVTVRAAGDSKGKAVLMALLSGLSEPLGALFAVFLLLPYLSESLMSLVMCFVAGVMVTVACVELIPEAIKFHQHTWTVLGFILGCLVMTVTHVYGEV